MKKIIITAVMFLMVLMAGCKDEIVGPLELDITHRLTMDKRSLEMYNRGCDVIPAADTLVSEYHPVDTLLLKSLSNAGYGSPDIVKVTHIVLGYQSRPAESTLLFVLKNETSAQIAELILMEYVTELNRSWPELRYFISHLPGLTEKFAVLKDTYGKSPEDITKMLIETGEGIVVVLQKMQTEFSFTEEQVLALLLKLKYSAFDITLVVRDMYNFSAEKAFDFLYENSYQAIEICIALQRYYNLTIVQICELLNKVNPELTELVKILKACEFISGDIINQLRNNYDYTGMFNALIANNFDLVEVLKGLAAGYDLNIQQVTELLESVYGDNVHNILLKLKEIGYSFYEIGVLLEEYYNLNREEISQRLKDIGADARELINFLTDHFNMTVEEIAPIINELHFELAEMVAAIWDAVNHNVQRLMDIFTALGYEICDILRIVGLPC